MLTPTVASLRRDHQHLPDLASGFVALMPA